MKVIKTTHIIQNCEMHKGDSVNLKRAIVSHHITAFLNLWVINP